MQLVDRSTNRRVAWSQSASEQQVGYMPRLASLAIEQRDDWTNIVADTRTSVSQELANAELCVLESSMALGSGGGCCSLSLVFVLVAARRCPRRSRQPHYFSTISVVSN